MPMQIELYPSNWNEFENDKGTVCEGCKHFYDLDSSPDGWHKCCSIGMCYLCRRIDGECDFYEAGDVPEGKTRGKWV